MTTVASWLKNAEALLRQANIASARLDAQLLLADALNQEKTWLIAHDDEPIAAHTESILQAQLQRRLQHEPMAYIRGFQAFYGRNFAVDSRVLIPRPETETIISMLKNMPLAAGDVLIDVGTGSGCIAISAKLERPELEVWGLDKSRAALTVAQQNAKKLQANVHFQQTDLLENATPARAAIITANLPYVDPLWSVGAATKFEPSIALFAPQNGLALIYKLLTQAARRVTTSGQLLLEADPRQHTAISDQAKAHGWQHLQTSGFILHFEASA